MPSRYDPRPTKAEKDWHSYAQSPIGTSPPTGGSPRDSDGSIRRRANRTRRQNPDQLALASEYRGALRKKKPRQGETNPNPPDYEGVCTLNKESYWISGWIDRRGPTPSLRLVFQLADDVGREPHQFLPDDIRFGEDPPF